jgi:SPP1 gp7 family putative phage head morphogenesis protein
VPLPVMGILDEATFSNYGTAVEQFWRNGNGVLAYLASVEDTINREFLFRLKDERARKWVARFDTSHVEALVDDNAKKLELAKSMSEANIGLSFDEAAKLVGLTGIETEFGDVAWVPTSVTTASEALAHAEEQEEEGRSPATVLSGDTEGSEDVTGEEDDFPGSDDFDSGSNGPTGSDGKSADQDPEAKERAGYFKSWEANVLRPGETAVRKVMTTYLMSYARAQHRALDEFAAEGEPGVGEGKAGQLLSPQDIIGDQELLNILLLAHNEWVEKLGGKIRIPLEKVLEAAADDIARELGSDAFTASDPWASDYLRAQRIRLAEGVNSTLAKQVKKALVEVFEKQPFSMASLQDHVRKLLPELQGALRQAFANRTARARAIARTEVNRAAAGTRYETMRRENVSQHQWVSSGDDQVRNKHPHSHRILDGKIVNVGDTFREGFTLRFPLDPDGDAADVINCRCVARPVVKD